MCTRIKQNSEHSSWGTENHNPDDFFRKSPRSKTSASCYSSFVYVLPFLLPVDIHPAHHSSFVHVLPFLLPVDIQHTLCPCYCCISSSRYTSSVVTKLRHRDTTS